MDMSYIHLATPCNRDSKGIVYALNHCMPSNKLYCVKQMMPSTNNFLGAMKNLFYSIVNDLVIFVFNHDYLGFLVILLQLT